MSISSEWHRPIAKVLLSLGVALTFAAAVSAAPDPAVWGKLQHAKWVTQGSEAPQHRVYVVMDANCPFCHDLWALLRTRYTTGLQVRYLMVGFLAANSPGKAAAILEASNPSRALDQNEMNFGRLPDDLGGGILPKAEMAPGTARSLLANETLIRSIGVIGTPALIYKDKCGSLHLVQSVPSEQDLDAILASATKD
jgi:thiol:disulfide interchange protein DsbG